MTVLQALGVLEMEAGADAHAWSVGGHRGALSPYRLGLARRASRAAMQSHESSCRMNCRCGAWALRVGSRQGGATQGTRGCDVSHRRRWANVEVAAVAAWAARAAPSCGPLSVCSVGRRVLPCACPGAPALPPCGHWRCLRQPRREELLWQLHEDRPLGRKGHVLGLVEAAGQQCGPQDVENVCRAWRCLAAPWRQCGMCGL